MIKMDIEFLKFGKQAVADWENRHADVTDHAPEVRPEDVFVTWYCKTLQNWKGLFSSNRPDGMYFELTVNGDKEEAYLDAYKKFDNNCIKL